jgi:hypothetical protein
MLRISRLVTTFLAFSFFSVRTCLSQHSAHLKPTDHPLTWRRHTLRGWWNPDPDGLQPLTILDDYDYIVVGSGPGGAPLATRLGLAGYKVLVIEAGRDEAADNINATVPLFNAKASEDERLLWAFYVRQLERQCTEVQC